MMLKVIFGVLAVFTVAYCIPWDEQTALDEYVHSDDGFYSWELLVQYRFNSCSLYIVNMTAQKWMDESFVDGPVWWHIMGIAIPDQENLTYPDAGFMFIDGGGTDPDRPPPDEDEGAGIAVCVAAVDIGAVGAYIKSIPNQPLVFTNDPTQRSRSEDSIIAWTWRTFIDHPDPNPDPTVIARFPMTKSAKRGLDTIADVARTYAPYAPNVDRFMVLGASKRGWTTWSLAATDQRVIAAAPLVFSMLNFTETLMQHYQSMGGAWSFAFGSYWNENLTQELLTAKAQLAFQYEDMYTYRERLTLPLLQIVSTGDEFFLCQDSHNWWDGIPDPKWTYMMENAEHGMFPHYIKIYELAISFYSSILGGIPMPVLSWNFGETADGGFIEATSDTTPEDVTVFRAVTLVNDTRRDFRLAEGDNDGIFFHPVIWDRLNSTLDEIAPNTWRATVKNVPGEWTGFLIRFLFRGPDGKRMFLTTETNIVPATFPVPPCTDGESCWSVMV